LAINPHAITTTGSSYVLSVASGNATQSGAIGGTGSITKSGAGTLTLTGNNSAFSGGVTLAGGTLRTTTGITLSISSKSIFFSAGGGTIDVSSGQTTTFDFSSLSSSFSSPLTSRLLKKSATPVRDMERRPDENRRR